MSAHPDIPDEAFIPHTAARVRQRLAILLGAVALLLAFSAATRTWVPAVFLALPTALVATIFWLRVDRFRATRALLYHEGGAVQAAVVNRQVDARTGYHVIKVRYTSDGRGQLRSAQVADEVAIRAREGDSLQVLVHPHVTDGFLPASLRPDAAATVSP